MSDKREISFCDPMGRCALFHCGIAVLRSVGSGSSCSKLIFFWEGLKYAVSKRYRERYLSVF